MFSSFSILDDAVRVLAVRLFQHSLTCSTAESCTGGMVGAALTQVAGSSAWFKGGIIAYANDVKQNLLGVDATALETYGAVSHTVVRLMALGACKATGADLGVSLSGVAGPDGGSREKPVGTVYIGVAAHGMAQTFRYTFRGDREAVRTAATLEAISLLFAAAEWLGGENEL